MSVWSDGRKVALGVQYCPWCGKAFAVPEGFKPPELYKCHTCSAEWVVISVPSVVVSLSEVVAKKL